MAEHPAERDRQKAISLVGELFAVLDKNKWELAEAMVRGTLAETRRAERKAVLEEVVKWHTDEAPQFETDAPQRFDEHMLAVEHFRSLLSEED